MIVVGYKAVTGIEYVLYVRCGVCGVKYEEFMMEHETPDWYEGASDKACRNCGRINGGVNALSISTSDKEEHESVVI